MTDRGKGRRRGRCGKISYRDEIAAKFILAQLDRGESRIYECNICFGHIYHITSQEQRTEKKTGSIAPQSIDAESSRNIA